MRNFRRLFSQLAANWQCGRCGRAANGGLLCKSCDKLRPVVKLDFDSAEQVFGALELPVQWRTPRTDIDGRFRSIMQKLHPDRHADPAEKALAESHSALVARAVALLRDPLTQATLVVQHHRHKLDKEGKHEKDEQPPVDLVGRLIEVEELAASSSESERQRLARELECEAKQLQTLLDGKMARGDFAAAAQLVTQWRMVTHVARRIVGGVNL